MFVLKKSYLSKVTLLLFLVTPIFIPAEFMSIAELLLCGIILCGQPWRIGKQFAIQLLPLFLLLVLGLHGISNNAIYDVGKDFWYVWKSIPQFIIGFTLMKYIDDFKSLLKIILLAALFVSLVHLSEFVFRSDFHAMNFMQIRQEYERGYLLTVIGLAVILTSKYHAVRIFRHPLITPLCLPILAISLYLSYSRTMLVVFFLFVFVIFDFFNKINVKSFSIIIVLTLTLTLTTMMVLKRSGFEFTGGKHVTFTEKILHSINELIPRKYVSLSDINQHWRGYESYMALKSLRESDSLSIYLFGRGFGAMTDLELYMKLGDREHRFIPVLHNGYIYILLKTGVIGLLFYVYFLWNLMTFTKNSNHLEVGKCNIARTLNMGLIFSLIFTSFVIGGIVNKSSLSSGIIIIGAMLCVLSKKHHRVNFLKSKGA